uniref:BtpA family membrane complex biogenesis protein n=1 Tax=Sinocyclocheilus anshuiensis TaxID=1608454 RepID=A0A671SL72_9TELE
MTIKTQIWVLFTEELTFFSLFGRLKSNVIGMIHDGLIIENMHDIPYTLEVGPEVCASMTAVCAAVRGLYPSWPLGVQILSAANHSALAVALASGLDFIRAEGLCPHMLQMKACMIRSDYITHNWLATDAHALTSDVSIAETAQAAEFFLSDGVIVTGSATGAQADPEELREVTQSVRIPVLIGSGVTHDNVEHYLQASTMIIGSHFKKGGYWANGVDAERVKRFMGKIHELKE